MNLVTVLAKWLHDIATVVWLGSLFVTAFAVIPASHRVLGDDKRRKALNKEVQRRLNGPILASLLTLLLTGLIIARQVPEFQGLFNTANIYSMVLAAKHLLVLIALALVVSRKLLKPNAILVYLNLVVGALILLLSAMNSAL